MPCYRCGARQIDPIRGPSLWKRGVRAGAHVLVCPDCQHEPAWTTELDHCRRCGSEQLIRVLGETVCRGCGENQGGALLGAGLDQQVELPEQRVGAGSGPPGAPGLSDEVAAALDRMFHRK